MSTPSLKTIKSAADILFNHNVGKLTRKREIIRARQITHYVAHKLFKHSCASTGAEIGSKDHATVLHSCRTIENEMDLYPWIKDGVKKLYAMSKDKNKPKNTKNLIFDLLRSKTVDPNIKVQLREILNTLGDEKDLRF